MMTQPEPQPRPLRITGGEDARGDDAGGADNPSDPLFASAKGLRLSRLDRALADIGTDVQQAIDGGAARVGTATIVGRLGEGAYGEVFVAIQDPPISRRIAIKILKRGLETKAIIARFAREQRALSRIDHPIVVPILDSGVTEDGRPWFSMPLLEGASLTTACDDAAVGLRERLSLFARVCDGVQAAHVQGIVHRDLKPGNILVVNRPPEPRIIDFGIACALEQDGGDTQTLDQDRRRLGTRAYMAPEQIDFGAGPDARSDVYSLGIILDELVTGIRPTPRENGSTATGIRALASCAVAAANLLDRALVSRQRAAQARGFDGVAAHTRALRGDIDAIIAKATMPEPSLRYQSAEALAVDIRRWLRREPVSARVASRTYVVARLVRRNPWAAIAIVLAILALGIITALAQSRAIHSERSALLAQTAIDQAREVNTVLANVLRGISPGVARGRDRQLMVEAIDAAAAAYFADLSDHSNLVTGEIARTLSKAYVELEQPAKAIALLEPALNELARSGQGDEIRLLRARLLVQLGAAQAAALYLSSLIQSQQEVLAAIAPYADALDEFAALGELEDPAAIRAAVELSGQPIAWPGREGNDDPTAMRSFHQLVAELVATLPRDDPLRWRYRFRNAELQNWVGILADYPALIAELSLQRSADDPDLLRVRTRFLQFEVAAAVEGRANQDAGESVGTPRLLDRELAAKWRALEATGAALVADNTRALGSTHTLTLTARLWHAQAAGFNARAKWVAEASDEVDREDRATARFDAPPEICALFEDLEREVEAIGGSAVFKAEEVRIALTAVRNGEGLGAWWRGLRE